MIQNSQILIPFLVNSIDDEQWQDVNQWLQIIAQQNSGQAWLIDRQGYLIMNYPPIFGEEGHHVQFVHSERLMEGEIVSQRVGSPYFERPMLLLGLPLFENGDGVEAALLIFSPVAGINSTIRHVETMMLYSSILAILLAMGLAYRWSKVLASPLQKMQKVALEMSEGSFGKTIELKSNNQEIDDLAKSMNHMSRKLKETMDDLVQEKNKLNYILTGMDEGVLTINSQREIILINKSLKGMLNLEDEDTGQIFTEVVNEDSIIKVFEQSLQQNQPSYTEITIEEDKTKKRILVHCTPIYSHKEKLWGVVGIFQDISERWRFEQLQKDFVANVSHELKTPLSSIRGAAEMLADEVVESPQDRRRYLKIILDEAKGLTNLVDGVLDLAEFDSRTEAKSKEKLEAGETLQNVAFVFKKGVRLDENRLQIKKPEKPLLVRANPLNIKQVLLNLLDNAFKFSPDNAPIELGALEQDGEVKFWVKDRGIGIPSEEIENVWERFYKADKARNRQKSGSGLGLAIVKEIIEQHKGRVFVHSKPNEGSTFGFFLPQVKD